MQDVGSLNGTYVNQKPVHVATLSSGNEVQVGKFRFVHLAGPQTGEPAASSSDVRPNGEPGTARASDQPAVRTLLAAPHNRL